MITQRHTSANEEKTAQACVALREMLADALRRGFFGTAAVEVAIQDGTIQHVRRRMEQLER